MVSGYRVELFDEQETVDERAVLDLWRREDAMPPQDARRRVGEVLQVATREGGEPVGVSTAYLHRNARLGMALWHYRFFVAEAHRLSDIGVTLALTGRDHLESLFASGRDRRGAGLLYEIENEDLKRYRNDAHMQPTGVTFIGENDRGDHVRVRWFPGAPAPERPSAGGGLGGFDNTLEALVPDAAFNGTIEVVRGRLTDGRAEQLLRFWSDNGALEGAAARDRLPEVVCLLLDETEAIAGVNSVYADEAPLVGRRFWIYRNFLLPAAADAAPAMMSAAFHALEEEFDPAAGGPIGLCALIADRELLRCRPEAVWPEVDMLYAGYTLDGRQVRIAYFEGALI